MKTKTLLLWCSERGDEIEIKSIFNKVYDVVIVAKYSV